MKHNRMQSTQIKFQIPCMEPNKKNDNSHNNDFIGIPFIV